MKFVLKSNEFELLSKAIVHADSKVEMNISDLKESDRVDLETEDCNVLLLHEICLDYLLFCGLDENYEITKDGLVLENLIDRFHDALQENVPT